MEKGTRMVGPLWYPCTPVTSLIIIILRGYINETKKTDAMIKGRNLSRETNDAGSWKNTGWWIHHGCEVLDFCDIGKQLASRLTDEDWELFLCPHWSREESQYTCQKSPKPANSGVVCLYLSIRLFYNSISFIMINFSRILLIENIKENSSKYENIRYLTQPEP